MARHECVAYMEHDILKYESKPPNQAQEPRSQASRLVRKPSHESLRLGSWLIFDGKQRMLTTLKIPYVAERFLGVTVPHDGVMYACSYDGLHKLMLEDPVRVETDEERREDYAAPESKGDALGIFGGVPILEDARTKIVYAFNARADTQRVEIHRDGKTEALSFPTLSGDWFFASLSKCGDFLLLAEPYAIEVQKIGA